jgi:3-keto-disaccharide hydrolase
MLKLSTALALAVAAYGPGLFAETVDFSHTKPGGLPLHWVGTQTGQGQAKWSIEKDAETPGQPNVLKQSGEAAFPVCIKEDTQLKDGFVEVRFKPIAGKEDQAGGVVWRVKDKDNYYVCRANALEDNVVLYKMVSGKRSVLEIVGRKGGYGVKERVAPAEWHTLRVEFKGHHFQVSFDGKHLFDVEDSTFNDAGNVGVWTKADSVTLFDDFSYGTAN